LKEALLIPTLMFGVDVTIDPLDFNFEAVMASIISTSSTVAPLIKISSLSDLISNKLPKD
jgi:hypothetical protein